MSGTGRFYEGYMDEIYVYNGAMQEEEIEFLATPPEPTVPSMKIISPRNLSYHVVGEEVSIQAQVISLDFTGVYVELYVDGIIQDNLVDSYSTEYIFTETGEYSIGLQAYSDTGLWAEDSVSISVVTKEEAEELETLDQEDQEDEDTSIPEEETYPDEWNEDEYTDVDGPDDEDDNSPVESTKYMHASKDEIWEDIQDDEKHENETLVEYIERINRENKDKIENGDRESESENISGIDPPFRGENGTIPDPADKENGNVIAKDQNTKNQDSASQNPFTWLFGGNETNQGSGTGNKTPGIIYILIIMLIIIAVVIASYIIIKKIYGRRRPKYYYD